MIPGMNQKMLKQAMKKMGVKQESLDAYEIIIKTREGNYIIKNPDVMKVNMMGQESLQVTGDLELLEEEIKEEDVKLVMEQAGCSLDKAKEALEKSEGDIAQAILHLSS